MSDHILDTHVFIWLSVEPERLSSDAIEVIENLDDESRLLVPTIVIWELGLLVAKKRFLLKRPIREWVQNSLAPSRIGLASLTPEIGIEANELPGNFHNDPADRMIVATSRVLGHPLLTRDKAIIRYGGAGHVQTVLA